MLKISDNQFWVFDLDDTLYKEIEFLKSAYKFISKILEPYVNKNIYSEMLEYYYEKHSTFDVIKKKYNFPHSINELVEIYRFHDPELELPIESKNILNYFKTKGIKMGLISDGRSITQRNKIKSLKISSYFQKIIISEEIGFSKPSVEAYLHFDDKKYKYVYLADNTGKDFISPNKLGWKTVCLLDNGKNIHKQNFNLSTEFMPQYKIKSLNALLNFQHIK